jgi:hypothetical protein
MTSFFDVYARYRCKFQLAVLFTLVFSTSAQADFNITQRGNAHPIVGGFPYADVWAEGNYAYVGSRDHEAPGIGSGVYIFDISNPNAPSLAAHYNPPAGTPFRDIKVVGGIGYFASEGGEGIHIVNLSNPRAPTLISRITSAQGGYDYVHNIFVAGGLLYEVALGPNIVKVFDVTNPAAPSFVTDVVTTDGRYIHDITVLGNRLFTSGWEGKTDIFDVSNIRTQGPVLLGSIYSGTQTHSCWVTPDGNHLVSAREIQDGTISIFNISNPANPILVSTIEAGSLGIDAFSPHHPRIVGDLLYVSWFEAGLQVFNISDPANPVHVGEFDTDLGPSVRRCCDYGTHGVYPFLGTDRILLSNRQTGLYVLDASAVTGAPTVRLTSPASRTVFNASEPITLTAAATDSNGINRVEFYADRTLIGTDTTAPYQFTWSNAPLGSHMVTVRAVDNTGAPAMSHAISLSVQAPTGAAYREQGGLVVIEAENHNQITGRNGKHWTLRTANLQYVGNGLMRAEPDAGTPSDAADGSLINTGYAAASPEMQYRVQFSTPGTYYVWLRAIPDNDASNSVHVGLNGQEVATADRISTTTYSDLGRSWTWFQGTLDGPVATLSVPSAGTHTVNVWMREDGLRLDRFLLTTSSTYVPTDAGPAESPRTGSTSTVPPTVSITSPTNGATFTAPATVIINANASDSDGTITQVEFFQGSTRLGADTTAPYSFTWSNVAAGSYSLTARATDNAGASTTSTAVNITVGGAPTPTYTLTGSPSSVAPDGTLTVSWTAPSGRPATDWIALYPVGSPNDDSYTWWQYTQGAASGSLTLGAPRQTGQYEFRYMLQDGYTDSARSNTVTVGGGTAPSPPAAPTGLTATAVSRSQINLRWTDNAGNEGGFQIERSTSATSGFTQIRTVGANATTYQDTGLASNRRYYYRVRAYNASGNSAYSNTANARTQR